jgi:hypothetical protein
VELLDAHLPCIEAALLTVSEAICKSARLTNVSAIYRLFLMKYNNKFLLKCWSLWSESFKETNTIPTRLKNLDEVLMGGFPPGSIIEVGYSKVVFIHLAFL